MRTTTLLALALAACGDAAQRAADTRVTEDTMVTEDVPETVATEVAQDSAPETVAETEVADTSVETTIDTSETVATDVADVGPEVVVPVAEWDPLPAHLPCAADASAPLLEQALAIAGLDLTTFVYTLADLQRSTKYYLGGFLDDPFLIAWQRAALSDPARAPCVADRVAVELDEVLTMAHPVAGAIRHAATELDLWPDPEPAPRPYDATTFAAAVAAICDAAGNPCAPASNIVPPALAADLTPLLLAIADGVAASQALQIAAPTILSLSDWITRGGFGPHLFAPYNLLPDAEVQGFLANKALLRPVVVAAARIAYEVHAIDWSRWRGQGIIADVPTTAGVIRIRGGGKDTYSDTLTQVLLLIDLGGDDVHEDDVGGVRAGSAGVSIAIDVDGADDYGYKAVASDRDRPWLLPTDDGSRYAGDDSYGFASASRHGRQGSGRLGIGMLFDLGGDADHYRSLTMSQGYAHLGVGVLYDDGGADEYASEESSQGSGAYGIGMLIDQGDDDDHYRLIANGQGAGAPGGTGVLHDAGGDDSYFADPGFPLEDGTKTVTYFSPQMPGQANSSSAQGAGTGIRGDAAGYFMSGGLGVLRDVAGDDHYTCGLFCQAGAFWQGIGILSDGAGADSYDALWYVQGGAAHYAIAMLLDGGPGDDDFNAHHDAVNVHLGAGHDFSLGLFINEAGDDHYRFSSLAAGASNCNGIGLFIDNAGDDTYEARSTASAGFGNLGGECNVDPDRPLAPSIGLLIDASGTDTWSYPAADFTPADASTWHNAGPLETEHGAGVDGVGESGLHAH